MGDWLQFPTLALKSAIIFGMTAMATVNTLGGHHSCTLLVSARWRIPEASTDEETVKARAADGYMWELPEQTPLRAMLPYLHALATRGGSVSASLRG